MAGRTSYGIENFAVLEAEQARVHRRGRRGGPGHVLQQGDLDLRSLRRGSAMRAPAFVTSTRLWSMMQWRSPTSPSRITTGVPDWSARVSHELLARIATGSHSGRSSTSLSVVMLPPLSLLGGPRPCAVSHSRMLRSDVSFGMQ